MSVKPPQNHDSESVRTVYQNILDDVLEELDEDRSPLEVAAAVEGVRREVVSRLASLNELPEATVVLAVDDLVDELDQEAES